ncbi:hypothetical protein ACSVC9_03120 [Clostridium sp. LBM24168]
MEATVSNIKAYVEYMRIYADKQPDAIKEPIKQYCDYVEELFNKNIFFTDITEFTKNLY